MSEQPFFDSESGLWKFKDPNGAELYWDDGEKAWKDQDGAVLKNTDPSEVKSFEKLEAEHIQEQRQKNETRKRKNSSSSDTINPPCSPNRTEEVNKDANKPPVVINKAVYVQGLPKNVSVKEVQETFSKCGIIAENIDTGTPRIKLYTNDAGELKGDALIVFLRSESVDMAVQLLDDTELHYGSGLRMHVQPASIDYKKEKTVRNALPENVKKKLKRRRQQQLEKLAEWDDTESPEAERLRKKWGKFVVLKHMFTLEEIEAAPELLIDLKEDITAEAEKCGEVTNVVLYDKEPDGIVMVRFRTTEAADECVRLMEGRFFDGRVVEAFVYDGKTRYQKTGRHEELNGDENESERLERFSEWIEKEGNE
ncbi:U2 snRNP-associated protein Uap2 [Schizosaccharomyces japonicus yFS275]|uniref:U2 snRNP-associated protein Uap2 n=1 Tax=Schizosaccharomyces japonicus (strain yFS275 / FY16936) TaxID=402676 RepID=B6JXZ2_SCHJY|nr:U2 snRNP-associated protein Uap2 [Schizosaccharomyces japonicus yFS275]EEB06410.1 U2 snRNP-associated protein Uap2 [Schizosaccharomyces japonicus yFS275]